MNRGDATRAAREVELGTRPSGSVVIPLTGPGSLSDPATAAPAVKVATRNDAVLTEAALLHYAARLRRQSRLRQFTGPDMAALRASLRAEAERLDVLAQSAQIRASEAGR